MKTNEKEKKLKLYAKTCVFNVGINKYCFESSVHNVKLKVIIRYWFFFRFLQRRDSHALLR